MNPLDKFITPEDFSKGVIYYAKHNKLTLKESIMCMAERLGFDVEHESDSIANLIDRPLRELLETESLVDKTLKVDSPIVSLYDVIEG